MKKDTTKYTERQKETLSDIARQLEMALTSDKTPEGVKDCLKTIIFEASNEAGLPLSDFTLIREAFPNIIEALPKDYGRGIYHSLHAILMQDTAAFRDFYDQRMDEEKETDEARIERLNRERKPYTDLLKSLSDGETARKFRERQLIRAKDLIGDILSVTTGGSVVTENNSQWGHGCLLELLGIFEIRHKNFFIPDFISELESYIFTWTTTYSDHQSSWKKGLLRERGLDYYGVELKQPTENCLDLSEMSAQDLETDDLDTLANQISAVMKNDSIPTRLFNAMADELSEMPEDWRTPEAILENLKALQAKEKRK